MSLKLNSSGGGSVTLQEPTTASDVTLSLPAANTTIVGTDATQTLTNKTIQGGAVTSGTAVASTSGTAIDFTGIPSWAKRVTVMLAGVSLSGTSAIRFRLGTSSGVATSGYVGGLTRTGQSGDLTGGTLSAGFDTYVNSNAATTASGDIVFANLTGNTWVGRGSFGLVTGNGTITTVAGNIALSGTLDRVRITTVNGTDTFDAGSINILYEG